MFRKLFKPLLKSARYYFLIIFLCLFTAQYLYAVGTYSGDFSYAGGATFDRGYCDRANAIAVDKITGGGPYIYVVGSSSNAVFGSDYFIIKYGSDGVMLASTTMNNGASNAQANSAAVDNSGNLYVTGSSGNTFICWIKKYNSNLIEQNSRELTNSKGGYGIVVDTTSGNVYVAAQKWWWEGNQDYQLVKYNSDLTVVLSSVTFNSGYNDYASGIAINPSGNLIAITGDFLNTGTTKRNILTVWYNSNLEFQSSAAFSVSAADCYGKGIAVDKSNPATMYVGGYKISGGGGAYAYLVLKYTNRVFVSSAVYNCTTVSSCNGITTDDSGNVFLTGKENYDFLTVKYNSALGYMYSVTYNSGYGTDGGLGIACDDNTGYVYVAGYSRNGVPNDDMRVLRYSFNNNSPILTWTGESNYGSDGLDPEEGISSITPLSYHVKYFDIDNNSPLAGYPKVHIKKSSAEIAGSPFTMTALDSVAFTTGRKYGYTTTLASAGNDYTYYFEAKDKYSANATGQPASPLSEPVITDPAFFTGEFTAVDAAGYDGGLDDRANAIAIDKITGGGPYIYVVGSSSSPATAADYFIIKYGSDGVMIASATYDNGNSNEYANSAAVDNSGNLYVTGFAAQGIGGTCRTIKYDSNLTLQASAEFSGSEGGYGIAVDTNSGNVYVAARKLIASSWDYQLVKYNSSLVQQSSATFNSGYDDYAGGIAINPSGNLIGITGYFWNTATLNNNVLTVWYNSSLQLQSSSIFNDVSSKGMGIAVDKSDPANMYVGGYKIGGSNDYFVFKYTDRVLVASAVYDCSGNGICNGITTDDSGNVFLTGEDNNGFLTLEYNPSLALMRSDTQHEGAGTAIAYNDITANLYVTGYKNNAVGNEDMTVLLHDSWNENPVLSWCGSGNYTSDGLDPETGSSARTIMTYCVKYADDDSNAPLAGYPQVHILKSGSEISGSPFTMTALDSGAFTTGEGRQYTYSKTLPIGSDYSYYFVARDKYTRTATGAPADSAAEGPVISEPVFAGGDFSQYEGAIYGEGNYDTAYAVVVDTISAGGPYIYTVGISSNIKTGSNVFSLKYNSSGIMLSSATIAVKLDCSCDAAIDGNRNVYITGTSEITPGNKKCFTLKYNNNLVLITSTTFNSGVSAYGYGIAVDKQNNVYVAGTYLPGVWNCMLLKYNSSLVFLSSASFAGGTFLHGIAVDNSSNVYVTGCKNNGTNDDFLTIKYNSYLVMQSSAVLNRASNYDQGYSLALDSLGNIYVSGVSHNGSNYQDYIIKYDSNFVEILDAAVENTPCSLNEIVIDKYDNVYIAGETYDYYRYIAKYNSNLNQLYYSKGDILNSSNSSITLDNSINVYAAGKSYAAPSSYFSTLKYSPEGLNTDPVLSWTDESGYNTDGLDYETACTTMTLTFRVKYADADNHPPMEGYPRLHIKRGGVEISNSPFTMSPADGNAYINGRKYTHTRTLPAGIDYSYYFGASDIYGATATGTPLTAIDEPDISNIASTVATVTPDVPSMITYVPRANNTLQIDIPANTFTESVVMTVSTCTVPASNKETIIVTIVGIEIKNDKGLQPEKDITLTLTYADSDITGLDEDKLVIGYYDAANLRWVPLLSTVYPDENKVVAAAKHLSKFALVQLAAAVDLRTVKVFPNPFNPAVHTQLTIDNLTDTAVIKIYTFIGDLVRTVDYTTANGRAYWDGKNDSANDVASGIYIAYIESETANTKIKIAVER